MAKAKKAAKAAEDDEDEDGGKRRYCTLGQTTIDRLQLLAARGYFGPSIPRVMRTMIEAGVRDARERGYLKEGE